MAFHKLQRPLAARAPSANDSPRHGEFFPLEHIDKYYKSSYCFEFPFAHEFYLNIHIFIYGDIYFSEIAIYSTSA